VLVNSSLQGDTAGITNTVQSTDCIVGDVNPCTVHNPAPVLSVVKHVTAINGVTAVDGATVAAGDTIQYTITVNNTGDTAGSSALTESVPAFTTYLGNDGGIWTGCFPATTNGPCTTSVPVAAHSSSSVTFTVLVNSSLQGDTAGITNTVQSTDCIVGDVNPCTVHNPAPVLSVVKHVTAINTTTQTTTPFLDGSRVFAGDKIQYTITATNTGDGPGTTSLSETVPTNTQYVGGDTYAGGAAATWQGCAVGESTGPCLINSLNVPAASSVSVTFTVQVNSALDATVAQISNTVLSPDCAGQITPDLFRNANTTLTPCTVTNPRVPSTLTVLKEDAANASPLAGAVFQLWTGDTSPTVKVGAPCTTAADGTCSVGNLEPGNYWWQETAAPSGYIIAVEFTKATTISRDTAGTTFEPTRVLDIPIPISVTGCETPGSTCLLTVKKVDAVTGQTLAGAHFVLHLSPSGAVVGQCTTGTVGTCQVHIPGNGTYYWVEVTAPNGYLLPANAKSANVVVNNDNIGTNIPATEFKDTAIELPHTGLSTPVGQLFGWGLGSVLFGLLLLGFSRRRRSA
jgi:uncharacterized repeat protein (TIGR01451 family)/LPXTG-motif cell wall-anchored protein